MKIECPDCKGRGEFRCECIRCHDQHYRDCDRCEGEGEIDGEPGDADEEEEEVS